MEQTTALAMSIQDNVTAVGHQGAPVSLTYYLPVMILVAILLSILTLMTVVGNLLVGLALLRYPRLRTVSNCLIGNLVRTHQRSFQLSIQSIDTNTDQITRNNQKNIHTKANLHRKPGSERLSTGRYRTTPVRRLRVPGTVDLRSSGL